MAHHKSIERDLSKVFELLVRNAAIPAPDSDHALTGAMPGYRDLHVHPDLLLIYSKPVDNRRGNNDLGVLRLVRSGSHSKWGF